MGSQDLMGIEFLFRKRRRFRRWMAGIVACTVDVLNARAAHLTMVKTVQFL